MDKKYFEDLLGRNKIEQLLVEWLEFLRLNSQDDLHGDILLLLTRFRRNEGKARQNSISENDYNLESNKIIGSIKDYLKEFESSKFYTDMHQPILKKSTDKMDNLTFQAKLNLIYEDLAQQPERKTNLETQLIRLKIPFHQNDLSEFEDEFKRSGYIKITAKSKDGIEIFLTQKGLDNLNRPQQKETTQPAIVFENYQNSIVNKGDNISQVGNFGNKTSENTPLTPNPNAPSRTIQRWQLIVGIIAVITAISLALLKSWGLL